MTGSEMTKSIVEVKGNFILLNSNGEEIHMGRPTVVTKTGFVEEAISDGKLRSLARGLPKKATDEEFKKFYVDSNKDKVLAVAAFCSAFGLTPEGDKCEAEVKIPQKRTGRGQKKADKEQETKPEGSETNTGTEGSDSQDDGNAGLQEGEEEKKDQEGLGND